jgi:iron complex outermembrane receptor protein
MGKILCWTLLCGTVPAALGLAAPCYAEGGEAGQDIIVNGLLPAADDTYRVQRIEVGPLGDKPLLDTPYSITVVPVNLAENQQLQNVRELFRYMPSVQGENIRPQSRGLQAGVVQNTRIDGLNIAATTDYAIEQFERIEVHTGLAGALYGPASPAGTFNYVFKRPTAAALSALKFGYSSDGNLLAHVDLSRRAGADGQFGLRVNLLNQDGESYADASNLRRRLASASADLQVTPTTRLEANGSVYHYTATGFPGTFAVASSLRFPTGLDPRTKGLGYRWAGDDNVTRLASGRLFQTLGGDWQLTGGALYMVNDRASTVPTFTLTNNDGAYRATTATTTFSLDRVLSNNATLRGTVRVGGIANDLFVGTTGFTWKRYRPFVTGAITLGTANLADPAVFAQPTLHDFKDRYHAQTSRQQSISFGDTITFDEHVSVLVAASQSWITARNINASGGVTSRYKDDGISPTASLLYKPAANMTAYLTYASSLEQGESAPSGALNAGEALAPYRSTQWELGYKVDLDRVKMTLAAYQIKRPYAFTEDGVYAVRGRQRNRGVEFTVNGRIGSNLNLFGGLAYLDPRLLDTGIADAAIEDKQILGLSKLTFSGLVEYRVPMLPELTLTAALTHASRRPGNYANDYFVSGYDVVDLGLRYQATIDKQALAFRLTVNNVGGERYWGNIAPNGQSGYNSSNSGSNSIGTLGAPRTVRVSIQAAL